MILDSSNKITQIQNQKKFLYGGFEIGEIDTSRKFNVYLVPTNLLTLNPCNSRFQSEFLNYGVEGKPFYYQKEGQKQIGKWILDQNKEKNLKTEKDIEEKGQQVPGLITADGLIINGNRRFVLLDKLYKKEGNYKYSRFKVVILENLFSRNYSEIKTQEIKVQFGKDAGLDYKRIDKMLSIRDFQKKNPSWDDRKIKKYFGWDGQISDLKLTLGYIDDYMQYCDLKGYYFVDGAEDQFKYLSKTHSDIQARKKIQLHWKPRNIDFEDYKYTFFKLLRSKPDQHTFRPIVTIKNGINVFSHESVWKKFKKDAENIYYKGLKDTKNCQLNMEAKQKKEVNANQFERIFKSKIQDEVKNLFLSTEYLIKNSREMNEPRELIEKLDLIVTRIAEIIYDKNVPIEKSFKTNLRQLVKKFSQVIEKIEN